MTTLRNSLDIAKPPAATRVVAAMSGGVDSSVVAALLKREGYDVIGVTLQLYDHGTAVHRAGACCAGQDIHDARRVAEAIGIPHYVLDYESRFRDAVIERFAESYLAGETPIPCVECNRTVKFRDLLDLARELGADALATGHYVLSRDLGDGHRRVGVAAAREPSVEPRQQRRRFAGGVGGALRILLLLLLEGAHGIAHFIGAAEALQREGLPVEGGGLGPQFRRQALRDADGGAGHGAAA